MTPLHPICATITLGNDAMPPWLTHAPTWVWWTLGAIVVVSGTWYLLHSFYRRVVWTVLAFIGADASVPRVLAWFDVPDVGEGGFLIDSAPSAAWPLALIAIAALVLDALLRKPAHGVAPDENPTKANTSASTMLGGTSVAASGSSQVIVGNNAMQAGGDINHFHGPVTIHQSDASTAKLLVKKAEETGRLKLQNEQLTAEKQKLEEQLAAALARGKTKADAGDPAAQQAIEEARQGDDPAKLQEVLIAERNRQEPRVRDQAPDWVELNRQIAAVAYVRGDIDVAMEALQKVLAFEKDDLDATNRLGHIYLLRGDLSSAERQYNRLLALAREDESWRAAAQGNLGLIVQTRGDLDAAEKLHREALEIDRKLGRLEGQANQLGNLGLIAKTRGDLDAAEKFLREALEINRKLGRLEGQAIQLANLGVIAAQRGHIAEARRLWTQSRDLFARIGMPHMVSKVQGWLDLLPPE